MKEKTMNRYEPDYIALATQIKQAVERGERVSIVATTAEDERGSVTYRYEPRVATREQVEEFLSRLRIRIDTSAFDNYTPSTDD